MTDDAEIKGFDPFAILGVTPSTEAREIKKQYRALSLIYHPDKVLKKCSRDDRAWLYFLGKIEVESNAAHTPLWDIVNRKMRFKTTNHT